MRTLHRSILAGALLLALRPEGAAGQAVLRVVEVDQDGKNFEVKPSGIVDINSTLTLYLDRDRLRARAIDIGGDDPALIGLLERLRILAAAPESALAVIAPAMRAWTESGHSDADKQALLASLSGLTSAADRILDLADRDPQLRARLEAALEEAVSTPGQGLYATLFRVVADEATRLRSQLDTFATTRGVYIQLGAWIESSGGQRPIHLAGFDEFPEAAPVDIERFGIHAIALTQSQETELKRLETTATAFNSGGPQAALDQVLQGYKNTLAEGVGSTVAQATACAQGLVGDFQSIAAALPSSLAQVADPLRATAEDIRQLVNQSVGLRERYGPGSKPFASGADLLAASNRDLVDLYQLVDRVRQDLQGAPNQIAQLTPQLLASLAATVQPIRAKASSCAADLQQALATARGLTKPLLDLLTGVGATSTALADFGVEVRRLTVDAVPSELQLPLRNVGARESGDRLRIRAAMGSKDKPRAALSTFILPMYKVLPHLETKVGIIFADPMGSTEVTRRFQAGASYSIVYKKGSRGSIRTNQFGLVGVGLNIAALDFNHDDVPELGAGVVVSLVADLLQAGIGYNVGQNSGYWFFGLRLPTPTINLAGSGVQTSE